MNIRVTAFSENDTFTVIEGYKKIDNCDDKLEDIGFRGDTLKIFYMIGKNDIEENFRFLDIDMKKRSQFGSSFLTLYTDVQTEFENLEQFPSSTFRLDLIRPDSRGDAKCKVFKGRSSANYY